MKEMVTYFSILAWKITWTEEPGGLQSLALQRVRHDLSNLAQACTYRQIEREAEFVPPRCSIGEGNGTPLQYSCLENPMDGGAWQAAVHGVAKSWTRLSNFPFTFHFHLLEKEMATHSSTLAWRIPGSGEPGGLPSMESHRVGHD